LFPGRMAVQRATRRRETNLATHFDRILAILGLNQDANGPSATA